MTNTHTIHATERAAATFRDAGLPDIDFDWFHRVELPSRLADDSRRDAAADVAAALPIAIQLDGARAYSYVAENGAIAIREGVADDAEVVLQIDEEAWQDYVYEFRTRPGLLYSGAVRVLRGTYDQWDRWDPALRCLYAGREVYNPTRLAMRDRDGRPLDPRRSHSLDDADDDMAHFLRTAGYLVVRDAFNTALVAELADEVDRLRADATEGEPTAWFTTTSSGDRMCYYLTYCAERSAAIAALDDHPVVRRLAGLAGTELVPVPDRVEGHKVVIKDFGMDDQVTGFANLPWHTDCGMGGCSVTCPSVSIGIHFDGMGPDGSQLYMMPGSWGKAAHQQWTNEQLAASVALQAGPCDATVHFGCNLHAGFSPTGPKPRRSLYIAFYNPRVFDVIGPHQGYQDQIPGWGNGEVLNPDEFLDASAGTQPA
jgi:hypothetical protein